LGLLSGLSCLLHSHLQVLDLLGKSCLYIDEQCIASLLLLETVLQFVSEILKFLLFALKLLDLDSLSFILAIEALDLLCQVRLQLRLRYVRVF